MRTRTLPIGNRFFFRGTLFIELILVIFVLCMLFTFAVTLLASAKTFMTALQTGLGNFFTMLSATPVF